MAIAAGVVLVADALSGLTRRSSETTQEMVDLNEQFNELSEGIQKEDHVIKLCEDYKKLKDDAFERKQRGGLVGNATLKNQ